MNRTKIVYPTVFAILFGVIFSASVAQARPWKPSGIWKDLLDHAGLQPTDLDFNRSNARQFGFSTPASPFFLALHEQPLYVPTYVQIFRDLNLSQVEKPDDLLSSQLSRIGVGIRRTATGELYKDELAKAPKVGALESAIRGLHQSQGRPLSQASAQDLKRRLRMVPAEIQPSLAVLIFVMSESLQAHKRALQGCPKDVLQEAWRDVLKAPEVDPKKMESYPRVYRKLESCMDFRELMVGGLDLAFGVRKAKELLPSNIPDSKFRFEWQTPVGWIRVGDHGPSLYAGGSDLLVFDLGGDDVYRGGGGSARNLPISVIIDLAGNDRYLVTDSAVESSADRWKAGLRPSFGAGVLGYGIVHDVAGNDSYKSLRQTQGRAHFGIGLLWDEAGDDVYDGFAQAQGSAEFGAGLLLDRSGVDKYSIFHQGQGFGSVRGVGYLMDTGVDADVYVANTQQIDFPSLVDPNRNHSMAQGVGFGFRGDLVDGHSVSGGVGVLQDEGGSNRFQADFFSQGHAYWYAVGILISGTGADSYTAGKYAQGTSAHYGVGVLWDRGGDDHYEVAQELGIGHGHDLGIGWFLEDSGNDEYKAPELSLGCASAQGRGFFWDRAGDDVYKAPAKNTLGCAAYRILDEKTFRRLEDTIGLFLDSGGRNQFESEHAGVKGVRSTGKWKSQTEGIEPVMGSLLGFGLVGQDAKAQPPAPAQ